MAYTAKEFEAAGLNALTQFPAAAQLAQVGDPRLLAPLRANSYMLAMLSAQLDVAQFEPFLKATDATVLADAAMRGVLPLSRPALVLLSVTNGGANPWTMDAGRRMIDPKGRIYTSAAASTIAPGATVQVLAYQRTERVIRHVVTTAMPFYRIEVTPSDDVRVQVNSLSLWLIGQSGETELAYQPEWCNVQQGDMVYQVEVDERRRMWIQLGKADSVGYQPAVGEVFEVRLNETMGKISDLAMGTTFGLEYIYTAADARVTMSLASVQDTGADAPTTAELRVISRYPALYDHNAVYLGEFQVLLRRYLTGVRFLSVWNEQVEEHVRGASVDNINTLFVSGLIDGMSDAAFSSRVHELIKRADSSYRVRIVGAVSYPVPVTVTASVAAVHDSATVRAQIRSVLLGALGDGSADVSEGMRLRVRTQVITALLKKNVPALQDDMSDFKVEITLPEVLLPEHFFHLTESSLSVSVTTADHSVGLWSY